MGKKNIISKIFLLLFVCFSKVLVAQYTSNIPLIWCTPSSEITIESSKVLSWKSEVGDFELVQENAEFRPLLLVQDSIISDYRVIDFSEDSFLDVAVEIDYPHTFFIVAQANVSSSQEFLYDTPDRLFQLFTPDNLAKAGNLPFHSTDFGIGDYMILTHRVNSSEATVFENGTIVNSGEEDRHIDGFLRIGASINPNRFIHGKVAEILLYDQDIDNSEIQEITDSLKAKYGPPPSLGPDRILVPDCSLKLDVKDIFKTYSWYYLEGSEEILIETGINQLEINQSGLYILECLTIFNELKRDTIEVGTPNFEDLLSTSICDEYGQNIDLNVSESSITVNWSDPSLTGDNVIIQTPGNYWVALTQPNGCSYQTSPFEIIDIENLAEIESSEIFCLGNDLSVNIAGFGDHEVVWSTTSTSETIFPVNSGQYWVEVMNANGCVGRDTVDVDIVGEAPQATFTTSTLCAENEVTFSDATVTDGTPISLVNWELGIGSAQGLEVTATYPNAGEVPISMYVELENGCTDTYEENVYINPLPLMGCNCDDILACKDLVTIFQSNVPPETVDSYSWKFSDGQEETGAQADVVFDALGNYTVTHIATTDAGCTDSTEAIAFEVLGVPEVNFSYDAACAGELTGFFEDVNTDESGPVFYNWNFDGQGTLNFPDAFWEFTQGVHLVTLTATGNNNGIAGCSSGLTLPVYVFGEPDGEIATGEGCEGTPIALTDLTEPSVVGSSSDPIVDRAWYVVTDPENPVLLGADSVLLAEFEGTGEIPILFEYSTEAGCSGAVEGMVFVDANPTANFEISQEGNSAPQMIVPDNNSTNAVAYTWKVNGEVVSEAEMPGLEFDTAGTYEVELVVSNSLGCSDSTAKSLSFINPEYDLVLVEIIPELDGEFLRLNLVMGNSGNAPITDFDLEISMGTAFNIKNTYEDFIGVGEVVTYTVPTLIEYDPSITEPYVCVRADNPNGVGDLELDLENNYLCEGLVDEEARFVAPYPNPTSEVLNLGIVLPQSGRVEIEINNSSGKMISSFALNLEKGYSIHQVDVRSWAEGLYLVKYVYRDQEVIEKVVISR